jgi:hypothetical protein
VRAAVCGKGIADARAMRVNPFSLEEKARMRCSTEAQCAISLAVNRSQCKPLLQGETPRASLANSSQEPLKHLTASLPLLQGEARKARAQRFLLWPSTVNAQPPTRAAHAQVSWAGQIKRAIAPSGRRLKTEDLLTLTLTLTLGANAFSLWPRTADRRPGSPLLQLLPRSLIQALQFFSQLRL